MITLRLDKNGGINKGDIKAFEHDNLSEVYIIQLYKNGAIYDLTNKSIELTMVERKRKIGDMVSLPIYEATEGKVKLEVVSDITKQDGIYDFKLTVKDTTGLIEAFPSFQVKIENDITDHITGEIVQDKNFTILTEGLKALADYNIYKTNALKVPEIEQDIVEINEQLDNMKSYSYKKSLLSKNVKKINIIGDSITHGANAPNIDKQSWAGILKERLLHVYDSDNYGFMKSVYLLSNSLGSYTLPIPTSYEPQYSWNINYQADNYIGQLIWYSTVKDSKITFKPQVKFKKFKIHYGQLSNGGIIHIYANNQFLGEINTLGEENTCKISQEFDVARLQFPIEIEVIKKDSGYTAISGFDFYDNTNDITINNYARSGNSLIGIDNKVLDYECNCDIGIFCLGHNDVSRDINAFRNKINRVISNYKNNNTFVIVCDFIWSKDIENDFRKELMRLATETNGMYICMDSIWGNDVNKLVSEGLLSDTSHPSPAGHKLIVDTFCKKLNIEISTQNTEKYYGINLIKNSYFNLGIETDWTFETDDINIKMGSNLNNNNAWVKGEVTPFINFSNTGEKNVNVKYYQDGIKVNALNKYKLDFSHIAWGGVCKVKITDNKNKILLEEYLETANRPLASTTDGYWNNLELFFKTAENSSTIKIEFIVEKTYNTNNGYLFLYGVKILQEGISTTENTCIIKSNEPKVKPNFIGQMYIDNVNNKVYIAKDIQTVLDWVLLN